MSWLFLALFAFTYSHTVALEEDGERWCATRLPSSTKRQNSCGLGGTCDDPAIRNAYLVSLRTVEHTVRVKFVMLGVSKSDDLTSNINAVMATMTKVYTPAQINFEFTVDYHPQASYDGLDATDSLTISSMKTTYSNNTEAECNVFVVGSLKNKVLGFAIFPTDVYALQPGGGVVLTSTEIGPDKYTLSHEFGHALGLLHTFEGSYVGTDGKVTTPCDPCSEFAGQPSNIKGDMCQDTPPTLENFKCSEPIYGDCRGTSYPSTDFTNMMGYGNNQCLQNGVFTPEQIARARCFLDRYVPGWLSTSTVCATEVDCPQYNDADQCSHPECITGVCQLQINTCPPTDSCFENLCDKADGLCKVHPKNCSPPAGLDCAVSTCNVELNACETNYTACGDPSMFQNDPCEVTTTPFCNNANLMDCICGTINDRCCTEAWSIDCTFAVAHCDDVRDCVAEDLPDPINMECDTAIEIQALTYKASINDFEEFQCEGGSETKFHGAWFYAKGSDWSQLSIDTCHFETAVSTSIFIFDDCSVLHCISHASSTGGCSAQTSLTIGPDEDYWFYIASETLGTIKLTVNGTAAEPTSDFPIGAIIAIAILAAVAVLILILIIYICCTATKVESF